MIHYRNLNYGIERCMEKQMNYCKTETVCSNGFERTKGCYIKEGDTHDARLNSVAMESARCQDRAF